MENSKSIMNEICGDITHIKKCQRCGKEKYWKGDDIHCPFQNGEFFADNWCCGQINEIRNLCRLGEDANDYGQRLQWRTWHNVACNGRYPNKRIFVAESMFS